MFFANDFGCSAPSMCQSTLRLNRSGEFVVLMCNVHAAMLMNTMLMVSRPCLGSRRYRRYSDEQFVSAGNRMRTCIATRDALMISTQVLDSGRIPRANASAMHHC